jgi:hypothetical protein
MLKIERWKIVDEFPDYEVSTFGRVRRLTAARGAQQGRVLKAALNRAGGRLRVQLGNSSGTQYSRYVHRLVAKAFIPNPDDKPEVNHVKQPKTNNDVTNLEWNTKKENHVHARLHRLKVHGRRVHTAKLTEENVREIRARDTNTTLTALANKFGVSIGTISKAASGDSWATV